MVDVGDDVFVVDDRDGALRRIQVKSAEQIAQPREHDEERKATYRLSRRQLATAKATELYFMFMIRWGSGWRFLLIPRATLFALRQGWAGVQRPTACSDTGS
jgi:hypothetical protein